MIKPKRVYAPIPKDGGYRILVERHWPRGLTKEKAKINLWLKDIAPSAELCKWFSHGPEKWSEFKQRFREELADKKNLIFEINKLESEKKKIDLLYSSKDSERNAAVALLENIKRKQGRPNVVFVGQDPRGLNIKP